MIAWMSQTNKIFLPLCSLCQWILEWKYFERLNSHLMFITQEVVYRLCSGFKIMAFGLPNFLFEMAIFILQFPRWNSFFLSSIKFRSHRNTENAFRLRIRICKLYTFLTELFLRIPGSKLLASCKWPNWPKCRSFWSVIFKQ